MFEQLTGRFDRVFKKLRSRGKLHPKQVDKALGEIREALMEADVAVDVADDLLGRVRERSLSEEVMKSLTPAQQVVKVVSDELTETLGGTHRAFEISGSPGVVMMAGLQGSGKTTACAKLALHLKSKGRNPVLAAADLQRPGAVEQLHTLGREIGVPVVSDGKDAPRVARSALKDAVNQARAFMAEVDLTGFVLTKLDGDARGGAALSVTQVTGRPIYFAGTGETAKDLEPFHPDRMAQRILGMGDLLSLVEKAERDMDQDKAREAAERMLENRFTFDDVLTQLREVRKLGPVQDLLAMMPGLPGGAAGLKDLQVDERDLMKTEAIICSMTPSERHNPAIISGSRRSRIARGSGATTTDVNQLLKQFDGARKMMKGLTGGKMRIPGMPKIPGL